MYVCAYVRACVHVCACVCVCVCVCVYRNNVIIIGYQNSNNDIQIYIR